MIGRLETIFRALQRFDRAGGEPRRGRGDDVQGEAEGAVLESEANNTVDLQRIAGRATTFPPVHTHDDDGAIRIWNPEHDSREVWIDRNQLTLGPAEIRTIDLDAAR